ncbi:hypothetical protein QQP08_025315 [Theobroma cacao]|nr:hypothetical protein QQP08_025315 [Theobroma cacao]
MIQSPQFTLMNYPIDPLQTREEFGSGKGIHSLNLSLCILIATRLKVQQIRTSGLDSAIRQMAYATTLFIHLQFNLAVPMLLQSLEAIQ